MARIRTIKPEFWTDENVVELSAFARLLFIGLWNFADDEGRMVYSEKQIKLRILPADDVDISALLGEIRRVKRIAVYDVDGVQYLQIVGFAKHQKVDKRQQSKLPPPPTSAEVRRIAPPDQGRDQGREEKEGGEAPPLKDRLFGPCLAWLVDRAKRPEGHCRSLVGKWVKDYGESEVLHVFIEAYRAAPIEPVGWIAKALGERKQRRRVINGGRPAGTGPISVEQFTREWEAERDRQERLHGGAA